MCKRKSLTPLFIQNYVFPFHSAQFTLLIAIDSWILRLQCIDQDAYNKFSVVHQGYALENSVIAVYERMDVEECKTMCIDEYRCRSINHSKNENKCEINDKVKETSGSSDFKAKVGYTYLATSYSTKNVGTPSNS